MTENAKPMLMGSILHLLHRAGQVADDLFSKEIRDASLTPRQYAVLVVVSQHDNASQTDIVNATGIDRSTLADIVKRLVGRGLVQRRRSKLDARAYALKLSPAGAALLRTTEPAVASVESHILGHLPASRRPEFMECLAAIARNTNSPPVLISPLRGRRH